MTEPPKKKKIIKYAMIVGNSVIITEKRKVRC